MRAVVTGGAGFIGSTLVDRLVGDGADVVVLDDLSSGNEANLNPAAELVVGDVADHALVARAVQGSEVVFHQAAHRSVFRSVEHPIESDRANTGGTLTVLVAARDAGVRRVVYASSSSVYGGASDGPTRESSPLLPRSPYAVSKLAGEHYCRVFGELYGLQTVALRYFNVYGPRQRIDSRYATLVPLFIDALRHGRSPEVHGDGEQTRDFTYITDVVTANVAAALAPAERCCGGAYNVSGGTPYSVLDILRLLQEILGTTVEPSHVDPRAGDVRHTWADLTRVVADLGHVPQVTLEDGLRRTVAWVETHEAVDR